MARKSEPKYDEDNKVWMCERCDNEYDTKKEALECCGKYFCDNDDCDERHDTLKDAEECEESSEDNNEDDNTDSEEGSEGKSSWYSFLPLLIIAVAMLIYLKVIKISGIDINMGLINMNTIILGIVIIGIVGLAFSSIKIVRPYEKGVIERFGKFEKISDDGLNIIIPFVQKLIKVPITEIRIDIDEQEVITKDNLNAKVDAMVYYKIKEVKKAIYGIDNYQTAVPSLAQTTLRAVVGNMNLSEANINRKKINSSLMEELDRQTDNWGIDVIRVEIQKIEPPADVQETMNKVVKAENDKISAINFANAVETEADGKKRAQIKEAEGLAKAVELEASAKANAIKLVNESAQKYFVGNAQNLKKLEVAEKALTNNTKYIIPEGTDISAIISEVAGITPVKKKEE